jgi:hypothetical protein
VSSVQRAEGGKDAVTLEAWKADRVHKMLVDPIGPLAAPSRMTESIVPRDDTQRHEVPTPYLKAKRPQSANGTTSHPLTTVY